MLKDINEPLLNQVYEGGLNESADQSDDGTGGIQTYVKGLSNYFVDAEPNYKR